MSPRRSRPPARLDVGDISKAVALAGAARRDDLRLGKLVEAVSGDVDTVAAALRPWLIGEKAGTCPGVARLVDEALRLGGLNLGEDVRDVGERLASAEHAASRKRGVTLFVQRYAGDAGSDEGSTLQALANLHGLTRERVRQINEDTLLRRAGFSIFSPAFTRIDEALRRFLPQREEDADESLRALLGPHVSLVSALRYGADVLNTVLPARIMRFPHLPIRGKVAWGKESTDWLAAAHTAAVTMISGCGLAYLPRVASLIHSGEAKQLSTTAMGRALALIDGFEWLDEHEEWFWFGAETRNNRLINGVRKLMAVARRSVDIEEIYGGISRMRGDRVRNAGLYPPPPWAVHALCSRLSFLRCKQSNDFYAAGSLDVDEELSPCERLIYRHMQTRGGLGLRRNLMRQAIDQGQASPITLASTLATSPILKHVDRAVFALRGWPFDATQWTMAGKTTGATTAATPHARPSLATR